MAGKSLLLMVQTAYNELALTSPSSVIGNTDQQVTQFLALANREGQDVYQIGARPGGWQALVKTNVITTAAITTATTGNTTLGSAVITNISPNTTGIVASTWCVSGTGITYPARVLSVDSSSQVTMDCPATATGTAVALKFGQDTYAMPSDFDHFITQTQWDSPYRWQLLGPLSAQEWEVLKRGISPTGPRRRFRIIGNNFMIDPVPTDSTSRETFEYFSNAWCQSATGTPQTAFSADTDTYALDSDLMILGIKWRFLRAKGLDYSEEREQWQRRLDRLGARDGGERDLPLNASAEGIRLLNSQNCPDTGFGS